MNGRRIRLSVTKTVGNGPRSQVSFWPDRTVHRPSSPGTSQPELFPLSPTALAELKLPLLVPMASFMSSSKKILISAACLLLALGGRAQDTDMVKLRADLWMPFNGSPNAEKPGYVVEIARAIFGAQGLKVDYGTLSWEETLKAARAGTIDGAIGTNATEAADLVKGSEPIGIPKIGLFALKDSSWKYENLQSLNTVKLGAIAGYSYWDSLDTYISTHADKNVVFFKGETPLADAIVKLNNKEIDLMPETLPVFVWALKTQGIPFTNYHIAYLNEGVPLYISFTKNKRGLHFSKMMDEGIRTLRANGQLAKILSSYGIEDWKE